MSAETEAEIVARDPRLDPRVGDVISKTLKKGRIVVRRVVRRTRTPPNWTDVGDSSRSLTDDPCGNRVHYDATNQGGSSASGVELGTWINWAKGASVHVVALENDELGRGRAMTDDARQEGATLVGVWFTVRELTHGMGYGVFRCERYIPSCLDDLDEGADGTDSADGFYDSIRLGNRLSKGTAEKLAAILRDEFHTTHKDHVR
jgi:hypothetical protein